MEEACPGLPLASMGTRASHSPAHLHAQLSYSGGCQQGRDEKESLNNPELPGPGLSISDALHWVACTAPWPQLDCMAHTPGLPAWVGLDGVLLS